MDFWYRVGVVVAATLASAAMIAAAKLFLDNARLRGQLEEREKRYDDRFATVHRALDALPQMVEKIADGLREGLKDLGDRFDRQAAAQQAELHQHGESLAFLRGQAEDQKNRHGR